MGFFGDTSALRASAASLRSVGDDFTGFGGAMPDAIPASAWAGPAAESWGQALPTLKRHLRKVTTAMTEGAAALDQLAIELDDANERYDSKIAAGLDIGSLEVVEVVLAAETAKRRAAQQLTALGQSVDLVAAQPYEPIETAAVDGMTGLEQAILAADAAGVVDPTPISDGTAVLLSLVAGDLAGAGLSLIGVVPYIGDAAKGAKYGGKLAKGASKLDDISDASRTLRAMDQADAIARLERRAGLLRIPNGRLVQNGYTFVTDGAGRTVLVKGTLRLDPTDRSLVSTQIGRLGLPGDHGGHLGGLRFGFPDHPVNIVPQAGSLNLGEYKKLENEWHRLIEGGHRVDVTIHTIYDSPTSIRPGAFQVEYIVDGGNRVSRFFKTPETRFFPNE